MTTLRNTRSWSTAQFSKDAHKENGLEFTSSNDVYKQERFTKMDV